VRVYSSDDDISVCFGWILWGIIRGRSGEGVLVEFDEHDAHVVAAQLFLVGVFPQEGVQHLFQHLLRRVALQSFFTYQVDQFLTVVLETLPDSVAADDDEVVVLGEFDNLDVGVAGNGLPVVLQLHALLVVEIPQTAGQIEVVVDASVLHLRP
jgi:hypothetical protein